MAALNNDILAEIIGFCDLCDLAKFSCVSKAWNEEFVWRNCKIVRIDEQLCCQFLTRRRWAWFVHKLLATKAAIEIFEWHAPPEQGHKIVVSPLAKSWLEYIAPSLRRCSIWWDCDEDMKIIKDKLIPNFNPSRISSLKIDGCSAALIPALAGKAKDGRIVPIKWSALSYLDTSISMPKNVFAFLNNLAIATGSLAKVHIGFPNLDVRMHPNAMNEFCKLISKVVSANSKTLKRFSIAGRHAEQWVQSHIFNGDLPADDSSPASRYVNTMQENCIRYLGLPLQKISFSDSLCIAFLNRTTVNLKASLPVLAALFNACHPDPLDSHYCSNLRAVLDQVPNEMLLTATFHDWILLSLENWWRTFCTLDRNEPTQSLNMHSFGYIAGKLFCHYTNKADSSPDDSKFLHRAKMMLAQVRSPIGAIVSCRAAFPTNSVAEWAKPVEMLLRDHAWWIASGRNANNAVAYGHPITIFLTSSAFNCMDALVRHPHFDWTSLTEIIGDDGETVLNRWISKYSETPALLSTTSFVLQRVRAEVKSRQIPFLNHASEKALGSLAKQPTLLLYFLDCFECPRTMLTSARACG